MALIGRLRPAVCYAIVSALTIALFIVLHVVGNRLPFDLAVERFAEEFRATSSDDWGMRGGVWQDRWHYCEFAAGVLADARAARDSGGGLREAIVLRTIPSPNDCDKLKAAVSARRLPEDVAYANLRHWMGGKALYAIALRHLTVRQFYVAIEALIYCGFLLVALALFLIGWRALLVGAPLLVFGLFVSALGRYSNIADGLPFAWALFATGLGAMLFRRGLRMSVARLFFFFAGMVSHYLWFFDGGNFVAATLIGLVVWLARQTNSPWQRIGRAVACVGVYAAGFAVSLGSRVALTSVMAEWFFQQFAERTANLLERVSDPWSEDLAGRDYSTFQALARIDAPTFDWLLFSAVALVLAATIAGYRASRCKRAFLVKMLGSGALFLPCCVHFLLPIDDPSRAARLAFLPLGLSWCCLFSVLTALPRQQLAAWGGGIAAALALSYAGTHLAYQWSYETKLARATVLSAAQENGAFSVHLFDASAGSGEAGLKRWGATAERELIYRRSPCSGEDLRGDFVLHLLAPSASLPDDQWRQLGFVNAGFSFYPDGQIFSGTCFTSVRVPDYAQSIRTGQSFYIGGNNFRAVWQLEMDLPM